MCTVTCDTPTTCLVLTRSSFVSIVNTEVRAVCFVSVVSATGSVLGVKYGGVLPALRARGMPR